MIDGRMFFCVTSALLNITSSEGPRRASLGTEDYGLGFQCEDLKPVYSVDNLTP